MIQVKGKLVDHKTRCEHYAMETDIIAIKFYCCHTYYPCFKCHEACAGHEIIPWPKNLMHHQAILCGVCKSELTIETYLTVTACPNCTSAFNENCSKHEAIYFDM